MLTKLKSVLACAFLCSVSAVPAAAEVVPEALSGDPHIQTVRYDPLEVVALSIAPSFALTVFLSPDERVETISVGDNVGWQVQVNRRADKLVIKALGMPSPTNLIAVTDQRTYAFRLSSQPPISGVPPYVLSFTYPPAPPSAANAAVEEKPVPGRYRLHGNHAVRPASISDDGQTTSIVWSASATLPAIYHEDIPGHRALINGVMREGVFVIEGVHPRLTFILGALEASATRIVERPHHD